VSAEISAVQRWFLKNTGKIRKVIFDRGTDIFKFSLSAFSVSAHSG